MGVDSEAQGDETNRDDAHGSRLPRLDSKERDISSQAVLKQEQRKPMLNKKEQERNVQDFRRPAAVVGISARYVLPFDCSSTCFAVNLTNFSFTLS